MMSYGNIGEDSSRDVGQVARLAIFLVPGPKPAVESSVEVLHEIFDGWEIVFAAKESLPLQDDIRGTNNRSFLSGSSWVLSASDFSDAGRLLAQHKASALLMLGGAFTVDQPAGLRSLAKMVLDGSVGLSVPRFTMSTRSNLLTSSLLYPLSRALFSATPRFPLTLGLCASTRMMEQMARTIDKIPSSLRHQTVWPVSEASVADCRVGEVIFDGGVFPQPPADEFSSLFAQVLGSFFADIDSKATFWQRNRVVSSSGIPPAIASSQSEVTEVRPMVDAFRVAYDSLHELWSLVLPPQSLVGLKRLSQARPESFRFPDQLWARTVYDFVLAFRLRTINRSHLLGALTPLYLGWVASHISKLNEGSDAEMLIEQLAHSFEEEKPYFVSRWRWPDRFNP